MSAAATKRNIPLFSGLLIVLSALWLIGGVVFAVGPEPLVWVQRRATVGAADRPSDRRGPFLHWPLL